MSAAYTEQRNLYFKDVTYEYYDHKSGLIKEAPTLEGQIILLTENAYLEGESDNPFYLANAVDNFGNDYEVIWLKCDLDQLDPSDTCDWESPCKISFVGDFEERFTEEKQFDATEH